MLKDLLTKNEQYPYVILKDWNFLVNDSLVGIELLVHNKEEFISALELSAPKTKTPDNYNKFGKKIDRKSHIFTLWTIEDNYFPAYGAERLLKGRVKDDETGVFILHPSDRFWSWLYCTVYHKSSMGLDDISCLNRIMPKSFLGLLSDRTYAHKWLCDQGFFPIKCKSSSVGYHIPE